MPPFHGGDRGFESRPGYHFLLAGYRLILTTLPLGAFIILAVCGYRDNELTGEDICNFVVGLLVPILFYYIFVKDYLFFFALWWNIAVDLGLMIKLTSRRIA